MFSFVMGKEEHSKQISLACVGSACSVWTTLGLPQFTAACAFRVYTTQVPECPAGHYPKQALHFMHFPGLSLSGSRSWVLRKGTDSVRLAFFAFPRSKQLRQPGTWQVHCVAGPCVLISSQVLATQFPGCIMRAPSQVHRVSPLGS